MESDVTQSAGFLKFMTWLEVNQKKIIFAVAGAVVVGLVIWYVIWRQEEKRVEAGESFSQVFVNQLTASGQRSEAAPAYLKVAAEYEGTDAGARALLMAAASQFTEGKFAEAQALFERFNREHRTSPLLGQAQYGLAASLDAQGKTNEAVTAYKAVVDRRSAENLIPQAKFALARLYTAQGSPEAALQFYQDLAEGERFTSLGNEAGMRAEELLKQYPHLAPKPEPITPEASIPLVLSNTITVPPSQAEPTNERVPMNQAVPANEAVQPDLVPAQTNPAPAPNESPK